MKIISFLIFVTALVLFAYSGTTTTPLLLLFPVGLLLIRKDGRISPLKLFRFLIIMMLVVTALRFARHIGKETQGGNHGVKLTRDFSSFTGSELSLENSFVIFQTFALVIDRIDRGDRMLYGKTYVLIPLYLIPGGLVPGKQKFIDDYRPDYYTLDRLTSRPFMGILPSGYYGEAYMNFGFVGLVSISLVMGLLVAYLDGRYHRTLFGLPGELIVPLAITPLVNACRMYAGDSVTIAIGQLGFLVLGTFIISKIKILII